jgi:hypothetical protein
MVHPGPPSIDCGTRRGCGLRANVASVQRVAGFDRSADAAYHNATTRY